MNRQTHQPPRPRRHPRLLRRWLADTQGALSVETVIVLPALLFAFLALVVFYDAFRTQKVNVS
ncbi:MAG TPA: hypothetical protein GX700_08545, partial [Paracoccus sp.]|nr:hypothetical protein [Paracoccus sp. (in: a-proteobacteria)]